MSKTHHTAVTAESQDLDHIAIAYFIAVDDALDAESRGQAIADAFSAEVCLEFASDPDCPRWGK